ncbi:hypothetical protein GCK72_023958 [Caenorhabditis remanei]|uniref:Vitellinogen open beta-sheet domain-containing protein n=1 Tax=Caenorhabditis remanei TaxID=31234 RepID=A0A6A5FYF5_CAERE|nr:hypothetical protein GCK72_023958 [Caenorhabditis remanei]KAF1747494.1 hypothetical protein GCK72_023958 [Caenorhabditis remanei]
MKSETRAKMVFVEEKEITKEIEKPTGTKEDIVYSTGNEMLIDQFYQQGDQAEFNPFKLPTEQKMEQLQEIFRQVQEHEQNTPETVHLIARAVGFLRSISYGDNELRSRRVQSGIQMLQEIVKKMNIRPHVQRTDEQSAHAVFYLRYKDMDFVVLPLDMQTIDNLLEKYVRNEDFDIKSVLTLVNNDSTFELHRTLSIYESERIIPTTIGVPLSISGKKPTIISLTGKVLVEILNLGARITLDVVPSIASTHVTDVRFWSPMFDQGVKSLQSTRLHAPVRFESTVEFNKNNLEITHKFVVPENSKTTASYHTRPVAFIHVPKDQEITEIEENTISHSEYQLACEEIDRHYDVLGLKINAQGNVLSKWCFSKAHMTEQDFEYTLENKNRPAEFVARFTIENLEKTDLTEIKVDRIFEKEFDMENNKSKNRRQYFNKMIREIQSEQGYKNLISMKFEAPQKMYWNQELRTVCDQYVRMCKIEMDCRRSPVAEETKEWTLHTELFAVRPEMLSSLCQLHEQPNREVQLALNAEWGSSKKSEIIVRAQLEQSKEQKKYVRIMEREFNGIPEYKLLIKAARLNQINVVSEYKLTEEAEHTFSRLFDFIKAYNFWSVSEKRVENEERRAVLQLIVEPLSRQYINMTIQTPQQQVELKNVRVPRVFLPTIARRAMDQQVWEKTGASCKVDQSEVSAFENITYSAPLTTGFSLVSKDFSEQPTFAVSSKKINKNNDDYWPDCKDCAYKLGDANAYLKPVVSNIAALWHAGCSLQSETLYDCITTKDYMEETMYKIVEKMFPPSFETEPSFGPARHVGCSQILKICPDKSLNGTQLASTEWSCATCSTVLNNILEIVETPIQKINENAASFFCKNQNDLCTQSFSVAITLWGPLYKIFKDPSTINNVCKKTMECVE